MYFTVFKAFGAQGNFILLHFSVKGSYDMVVKGHQFVPVKLGTYVKLTCITLGLHPSLACLGVQITALATGIPGWGRMTCRQPLCPSTQHRGQPGSFYVVMFRWTLPPASFAIMSPAMDLAHVLPNISGLNSPEGILGNIINSGS